MNEYLILRLAGPMQAWGQPTFEGTRPTARCPTRSGLLGLLGACLGMRRDDRDALQALSSSVRFAVHYYENVKIGDREVSVSSLSDYHTVLDARVAYRGLKSHDTIQTWREYLCDAAFTVAVWSTSDATISLTTLREATQKPRFTPYLGRRSCPFTEPLFRQLCQAVDPRQAFDNIGLPGGIVCSEEPVSGKDAPRWVRDEPIIALPRQFANHRWYILSQGAHDVSE